jgi:hypothetical protein
MRDDQDYDEYQRNCKFSLPPTLYKYRDTQTARIVLLSRRLRHSSPIYFREMNDCQWHPLWPLHNDQVLARVAQARIDALKDPYVWPSDADHEWLQVNEQMRLSLDFANEDQRKRILGEFEVKFRAKSAVGTEPTHRMLSRMRLLCVKESLSNPDLWTTYADNSRGVALGFSARRLRDQLRRPLEPVTYRDDPPGLRSCSHVFQATH